MNAALTLKVIAVLILALSTSSVFGPLSRSEHQHSPSSSDPERISQSSDHSLDLQSKPGKGQALLVATVDVKNLPPPVGVPSSTVPYTFLAQNSDRSSSATLGAAGHFSPATAGLVGGSSVNIVSRFEGLNQLQSCHCTPPDVQVAAGPNHVFEMVNTEGEIYSKQGTPIQALNLTSFFHTGNKALTDPKILFDASSGRWFASIIEAPNGNFPVGNITIAVSTSIDATGAWSIYVIATSASQVLPDQPILGVSDDKVTVSANAYMSSFIGGEYWILNKSEMTSGAVMVDFTSYGPVGSVVTSIDPSIALGSVHPVHSLSPTQTQYMVSTGSIDKGSSATSAIQLFAITGVPPANLTLQMFSLPISRILAPLRGSEPGVTTFYLIQTDDLRVEDAAWYQGKLWLTVNDQCTPPGDTQARSCIRLIEIDTTKLKILQDFDYCAVGTSCYYGALRIDSQGNLAFIYGFSSTIIYPSLAVSGQAAGDPPNTLRRPQILVNGTAVDNSTRYGDYFGAGLDPTDQTLVWLAGEYHNTATGNCTHADGTPTGNCWSTFIGSVRVAANDISISSVPTFAILTSGTAGSATITLTITSQGGFAGAVSLSTSVSPAGPSVTLNTTTVNLFNPGDSAGVKLTISTTSSVSAGGYTMTVTGTTPSSTVAANLQVSVTGFSVSSSPSLLSLAAGSSSKSTVTVTSLNGFAGTITLTNSLSASGPTSSLSPASIILTPGRQGSSVLAISAPTPTARGLYVVTIVGTSGSQSHSTAIPFIVTPLTFNINNVQNFTGETIKTVETLSVDSPSTSLSISGTASIVATNSTTKAPIFSNNYTITQFPIIGLSGGSYYTVLIYNTTAAPNPISSETLIRFSPASPPSTSAQVFPERNPDINQDGLVDSADYNTAYSIFGCQAVMQCYNPRADIDADGTIDSIDLNVIGTAQGFPNINPSYSVSTNPSLIAISPNAQGSISISLKSLAGFAGSVSLSVSSTPAGITSSLSPTASLIPGGTTTTTLTVSSANLGFFVVNVTGASGITSRSALIFVKVEDFFFPRPFGGSQTAAAGSSVTFPLIVTSIFDYAGTVSLTSRVTPAPANVPTISFNPGNVTVPLDGTTPVSMTVFTTSNTPALQYSILVNATDGLISHTMGPMTVSVQNFNISANPTTLQLAKGTAVTSNITLSSQNGFSGTLSLTATVTPVMSKGPTVSLALTTVTLNAGGNSVSTLTISTITGTPKGTYTITVTVTSGPTIHQLLITAIVS